MPINTSTNGTTDAGAARLARELVAVRDTYCGGSNRELARRIGRSEYVVRRLIRPLEEPGFEPNPTAETLQDVWGYLRQLDEYRGLAQSTVFEWAGQIVPRPPREARLDELAEVLEGLTERERREVLEFARLKARLAEERTRRGE